MVRFYARRLIAVGLLAVPAASDVHAQRLLEVEGIELRGTARVVEFGAATCNVVEERETASSYEQKRASHGQPIDIWQLDFSVYNGSGRPLDHVIALYRIEAEDLPCTNWDLSASANYSVPVQWSGAAGQIQRSGSRTAPGETLTTTSHVWVFHDQQPRFEMWNVVYTFAPADAAAPRPTDAPGAAAPGSADVETPPVTSPVDPPSAPADLTDPDRPPTVEPADTCASGVEPPCWMELANHPGCYVWHLRPQEDETVSWSGGCSGGYAQGTGTRVRRYEAGEATSEGSYSDGIQTGYWVSRYPNGLVEEGPFVDGELHGQWRIRYPSGSVYQLSYVNGEFHGDWIIWSESGNVSQRSFVNGERHGPHVTCELGEPANVGSTFIWEHGEIVQTYLGYEDIDDPQLARTVAATCVRLLSMPRPSPGQNR